MPTHRRRVNATTVERRVRRGTPANVLASRRALLCCLVVAFAVVALALYSVSARC